MESRTKIRPRRTGIYRDPADNAHANKLFRMSADILNNAQLNPAEAWESILELWSPDGFDEPTHPEVYTMALNQAKLVLRPRFGARGKTPTWDLCPSCGGNHANHALCAWRQGSCPDCGQPRDHTH